MQNPMGICIRAVKRLCSNAFANEVQWQPFPLKDTKCSFFPNCPQGCCPEGLLVDCAMMHPLTHIVCRWWFCPLKFRSRSCLKGVVHLPVFEREVPLFDNFTLRPKTSPNMFNVAVIIYISRCAGVIIAVSSANCSNSVCAVGRLTSSWWSLCIICWSISAARRKRRG
jgi:hypothetical protein